MQYRLLGRMALFWEAFSGKRFVCCALTVLYSIYNMVGMSIASISDLGALRLSKYVTSGLIYWLKTSLLYYIYYVSLLADLAWPRHEEIDFMYSNCLLEWKATFVSFAEVAMCLGDISVLS